MRDFDADLKRAFAELPDPVDSGFSAAVSRRVAKLEKSFDLRFWIQMIAFVIAGGAFAYGVVGVVQAIGPSMVTDVSGGFEEARTSIADGVIPASLGALVTPLLIAAAVGVGGFAVARTMTDFRD